MPISDGFHLISETKEKDEEKDKSPDTYRLMIEYCRLTISLAVPVGKLK